VISGIGGVPQQPHAHRHRSAREKSVGQRDNALHHALFHQLTANRPLRRVPRVARLVRHHKCGASALGQDGQGVLRVRQVVVTQRRGAVGPVPGARGLFQCVLHIEGWVGENQVDRPLKPRLLPRPPAGLQPEGGSDSAQRQIHTRQRQGGPLRRLPQQPGQRRIREPRPPTSRPHRHVGYCADEFPTAEVRVVHTAGGRPPGGPPQPSHQVRHGKRGEELPAPQLCLLLVALDDQLEGVRTERAHQPDNLHEVLESSGFQASQGIPRLRKRSHVPQRRIRLRADEPEQCAAGPRPVAGRGGTPSPVASPRASSSARNTGQPAGSPVA
jgi:hypothetical protein